MTKRGKQRIRRYRQNYQDNTNNCRVCVGLLPDLTNGSANLRPVGWPKKENLVTTKPGLIIAELPDGAVIYDPNTGEAHHLNQAAAAVFIQCQRGEQLTESPETDYALDLLSQKGLLIQSEPLNPDRRQVLKTLVGSVALPAIASIFVPHPAAAASGTVTEAQCETSGGAACGMICNDGGPIGG